MRRRKEPKPSAFDRAKESYTSESAGTYVGNSIVSLEGVGELKWTKI
jgi:hypothetical protein